MGLSDEPKVIEGGVAIDERGALLFVNDFNFAGVKRFYVAENFSQDFVRAFHGHKHAAQFAFVIDGSALLVAGKLTNDGMADASAPPRRFILSSRKPSILYIPPGYANGFKALEKNTRIMFFSTASLEEIKQDYYHIPYDAWDASIWEIENQ